MTPGGVVAVVLALITAGGTTIGSWVAISTMRNRFAKERHNQLREYRLYADEIGRYHDRIRRYLRKLADDGVIDIERVDLSQFPPPPPPKYNGNGD